MALQIVQKDVEYVTRDIFKRRENIVLDNGGTFRDRYEDSRRKIEEGGKLVADWKVRGC